MPGKEEEDARKAGKEESSQLEEHSPRIGIDIPKKRLVCHKKEDQPKHDQSVHQFSFSKLA
jgi:hypothetical protein